MNKEKIKEQAKAIMDDFIEALDKIKDIKEDIGFKREKNTREKSKHTNDADFRERIFKNAPKVEDDFIVMEKKTW